MIHELRTYTVQPGKAAQYVEQNGAIGRPIRGDRFGKLIGYWSTELGPLNQVVHIWEYADLGARAEARAGLARDPRWISEYLPVSGPLLVSQDNMILTPAPWWPLKPPAEPMGIYELRAYRLRAGTLGKYLDGAREAMTVRTKYSSPVGFWSVDIGPLNSVVHLWGYRDLNHRAEVRRAANADPAWQAALGPLTPLMLQQESKILVPAPFSPLR
jgi:hypothetical protein